MTVTTDLVTRAGESIPGGVFSATRRIGDPTVIVSGSGSHLVDERGRSFLDFHAAFGAVLLGYHDHVVDAAVHQAVTEDALYGIGVTRREVEFAERVVDAVPSVEMVIAATSGTEATFQAVRLSRAVTDKTYLVKFQGNFHGWHDAVARNVISSAEKAYQLDPLSSGILDDALSHTLIAEFNDLASVQALFDQYPGEIAAVILEPVAHNVGCLVAEPDFLLGLRSLTASEGALLIFDEVITGFRHSLGGFQANSPVLPDLTTLGKGVGNGYPVAGLGGRRDLMAHFAPGGDVLLAGTFNGHPASMAAATATIDVLTQHDPGFYERTHALTRRAADGLTAVTDSLGIAATAVAYGSVFALYFLPQPAHGYRDLLHNNDRAYVEFHRRMIGHDILMLPLALKRNHVSGAHTAEDIDQMLEASEVVLRSMVDDGTLR